MKKEISHVKKASSAASTPKPRADAVLRLRIFALTLTLACLGTAVPLLLVGKEAYVTRSATRQRILADSIAILQRDAERLRMRAGHLSQVARIELIAREHLELDYPLSDQIIIVARDSAPAKEGGTGWEFLSIFRRSFTRDNS